MNFFSYTVLEFIMFFSYEISIFYDFLKMQHLRINNNSTENLNALKLEI